MRRTRSPRTPVVKRGRSRTRSLPPTPRSMARRRTASSSRSAMSISGRSVASRLGLSALRGISTNPYVRGALAVAPYARRGYRLLRRYVASRTAKPKRSGASTSKSAGYFSDFKGDKNPKMADYMFKGACMSFEQGDVVTSTRQAIYLAHSTCPRRTTLKVVIAGLLKYLFRKAGIKIKNWVEPVLEGANIPARIEIKYKQYDGEIVTTAPFLVPITKTFDALVNDVSVWVNGFTPGTYPTMMLSMQYYHDVGTIGSSRLVAYDIDLTAVDVHLFSKSALKIQNRTINSDGNDQADDVDNVPLYGRHFTVRGNGTVFRDFNTPVAAGTPQLRTDTIYGVLNYSVLASEVGSTLYNEVALKNQLLGVTAHGPAHLDPGEVKTSKLTFTKTINFNKFLSLYYARFPPTTAVTLDPQPFNFGISKIFGFEKMINAVTVTATNAPKIAYEHQLDIGSYVTVYQNHQTALLTQNNTGPLAMQ